MLIFLDDLRSPDYMNMKEFEGLEHYPISVVRSAKEAIELIGTGNVKGISFDHDLGTKLTGYDVAKAVEYLVAQGKIRCPLWDVHSANIVGAKRIRQAMISAEQMDLDNEELELLMRD